MGVSLEGVKEQVYSFFSEIHRRRAANRKWGKTGLKSKKKTCDGTPGELKRLESLINYNGRRKEDRDLGVRESLHFI